MAISTITLGDTGADAKLRQGVITKTAASSYLQKLSKQSTYDLTTNAILAITNYSGSSILGEGMAKPGASVDMTKTLKQSFKELGQLRMSEEATRNAIANGWSLQGELFRMISESLGYDFDIAATHGTNAADGKPAAVLTDWLTKNAKTYATTDKVADDLVETIYSNLGSQNKVSGIVVTPEVWGKLATATNSLGVRTYPQFTGVDPNVNSVNFEGVQLVMSDAIAYKDHQKTQASGVEFIAGDFANNFVFGFDVQGVKLYTEGGDPDGLGRDLTHFNESVVRVENFCEYYVRDGASFTVGTKA